LIPCFFPASIYVLRLILVSISDLCSIHYFGAFRWRRYLAM
jgi:hypothetical protein